MADISAHCGFDQRLLTLKTYLICRSKPSQSGWHQTSLRVSLPASEDSQKQAGVSPRLCRGPLLSKKKPNKKEPCVLFALSLWKRKGERELSELQTLQSFIVGEFGERNRFPTAHTLQFRILGQVQPRFSISDLYCTNQTRAH